MIEIIHAAGIDTVDKLRCSSRLQRGRPGCSFVLKVDQELQSRCGRRPRVERRQPSVSEVDSGGMINLDAPDPLSLASWRTGMWPDDPETPCLVDLVTPRGSLPQSIWLAVVCYVHSESLPINVRGRREVGAPAAMRPSLVSLTPARCALRNSWTVAQAGYRGSAPRSNRAHDAETPMERCEDQLTKLPVPQSSELNGLAAGRRRTASSG